MGADGDIPVFFVDPKIEERLRRKREKQRIYDRRRREAACSASASLAQSAHAAQQVQPTQQASPRVNLQAGKSAILGESFNDSAAKFASKAAAKSQPLAGLRRGSSASSLSKPECRRASFSDARKHQQEPDRPQIRTAISPNGVAFTRNLPSPPELLISPISAATQDKATREFLGEASHQRQQDIPLDQVLDALDATDPLVVIPSLGIDSVSYQQQLMPTPKSGTWGSPTYALSAAGSFQSLADIGTAPLPAGSLPHALQTQMANQKINQFDAQLNAQLQNMQNMGFNSSMKGPVLGGVSMSGAKSGGRRYSASFSCGFSDIISQPSSASGSRPTSRNPSAFRPSPEPAHRSRASVSSTAHLGLTTSPLLNQSTTHNAASMTGVSEPLGISVGDHGVQSRHGLSASLGGISASPKSSLRSGIQQNIQQGMQQNVPQNMQQNAQQGMQQGMQSMTGLTGFTPLRSLSLPSVPSLVGLPSHSVRKRSFVTPSGRQGHRHSQPLASCTTRDNSHLNMLAADLGIEPIEVSDSAVTSDPHEQPEPMYYPTFWDSARPAERYSPWLVQDTVYDPLEQASHPIFDPMLPEPVNVELFGPESAGESLYDSVYDSLHESNPDDSPPTVTRYLFAS